MIEVPLDDVLDINGWDLRKALQLMRKSNSPLLEWLSSPIQYLIRPKAFEPLLELSKRAFMPETACHHYLSMAKASISNFPDTGRVKLKTYMYAVRPLLGCKWIIKYLTQPPMRIQDLLDEVVEENDFKNQIVDLVDKKKTHSEGFMLERDDVIEKYLKKTMAELQPAIPKNPPKPSLNLFDELFRSIVNHQLG